jgi:hypothetical protein
MGGLVLSWPPGLNESAHWVDLDDPDFEEDRQGVLMKPGLLPDPQGKDYNCPNPQCPLGDSANQPK